MGSMTLLGAGNPPVAAAGFSALINFRGTSGFVTDGGGQTYCLDTDTYPTTRAGLTFGWETAVSSSDRDNSVDPRLAGVNYTFSSATFRLDLPATGGRTVRLAGGDANFAGANTDYIFIDNASTLYTVNGAGTLGTHWLDANGSDFSGSPAWVSGNTTKSLTFGSTIFRLTISKTGGAGGSVLAHIAVV